MAGRNGIACQTHVLCSTAALFVFCDYSCVLASIRGLNHRPLPYTRRHSSRQDNETKFQMFG